MLKNLGDFYLIVNWIDGKRHHCEVLSYSFNKTTAETATEIVFKYDGLEYTYKWYSNANQGLASVFCKGEHIYDPYSKQNTTEGNLAQEMGRQIAVNLQPKMP